MLYYKNLDDLVFTRNQLIDCDELVILSGYIGPFPVRRLKDLPIKSTVIYGMYASDGIRENIHNELKQEVKDGNVELLYSTVPIHSKCYVWRSNGIVVHALIGSANFSINGLTTPFKEVLAETSFDTFKEMNSYLSTVIENSIACDEAVVITKKTGKKTDEMNDAGFDEDVCTLPLFITRHGSNIVPDRSGLNWGLAKKHGSHVNVNDAYIPIRKAYVESYPDLFPIKQQYPVDTEGISRVSHRHNDNVEILWDDGSTMKGLLEGSQTVEINGIKNNFPKQFSSTPHKSELGKYLRKRLGVDEGVQLTYDDLEKYGRNSIDVSLQGEGIYFFDFSV